ncbi:MAG: ATP-grasp domain-containing protein, partial [Actinobacteria bacterium]|nr:ATP-grasp domain-containing protein [Actinomycetota bacterium]NIS36068.1 ATP-grasp domain-containing protein [Actinomycetota bacterium]NIU22125.1 ATP-grasp domain-containing protein [Actinomycetota bacterium]NIU70643.1 ATP-grasp domain-containing protein [Actinomycetota bacterium]NIV90247.1 ATP-grasp domain-containing protein [Actinomycetota bacterium]
AAADLGLDVIVVSDGDLPLGGERVESVIVTDLTDAPRAAQAVASEIGAGEIGAVIGVDDGAVLVAAELARTLGVPHTDPQAVAATRDKALMRDLLASGGVPQPRSSPAASLDEAAEAAERIGYPVVVKPRTLSASRGVIRVDDERALGPAWERVRTIADEAGARGPLLVEEFVPGPEVAVEALVGDDG